jgi:hypothetical protein
MMNLLFGTIGLLYVDESQDATEGISDDESMFEFDPSQVLC